MEKYFGRAWRINNRVGAADLSATDSQYGLEKAADEDETHEITQGRAMISQIRSAQREDAVLEVYEIIRDAGSDETPRAIQDSESETALLQKRMINGLAAKGWRKNDIIAEL